MDLKKNVVEYVINSKKRNASHEDIIHSIKELLYEEITDNQIVQIWEQAKNMIENQQEVLSKINNAIDDKPKYDVVDNHYVLYAKDKATDTTVKFSIPVETVDQIFNDYSRYGANMSGQAIMNKYSLKPKVRNLIKSHIGLYKDSHILSPMSMDHATEQGNIEEVIHEASYKNFEDKYKHKYKEAHHNILEKEVKNLAKIVGTLDGFIEYIQPKLNILPIKFKKVKKLSSNENTPVYVFGDKHFGKRDTE